MGEARSDREVFPEGWEGSDGPPGELGGVGRTVEVGRPSWMARRDREGSGGPPGRPKWVGRPSRTSGGGVGRLSRMAGRGRESLPERWKPLGVSPGEPEGWESLPKGRMGQEALLEGWEGYRGPP